MLALMSTHALVMNNQLQLYTLAVTMCKKTPSSHCISCFLDHVAHYNKSRYVLLTHIFIEYFYYHHCDHRKCLMYPLKIVALLLSSLESESIGSVFCLGVLVVHDNAILIIFQYEV